MADGREPAPRAPRRYNPRMTRDDARAILQRHKPQMDSAWAEMRPRVETLRETIRSEIAAQLDSAQRVKFDDLNRRDASRRPGP